MGTCNVCMDVCLCRYVGDLVRGQRMLFFRQIECIAQLHVSMCMYVRCNGVCVYMADKNDTNND